MNIMRFLPLQSPSRFAAFFLLTACILLPTCAWSATASSPPAIAQVPLFLTPGVEPNILLALDNSGSMDSEVLFPTNDGALWWNSSIDSFRGCDQEDNCGSVSSTSLTFNFNKSGNASGDWYKYFYLFPEANQANSAYTNVFNNQPHAHFAVPPIPAYAFARSPDYNKAYFDPSVTYSHWKNTSATNFLDSSPTAAPLNPNSSVTVDLTKTIAQYSSCTTCSKTYNFEVMPQMSLPSGTWYKDGSGNGWQQAPSGGLSFDTYTVPKSIGIAYYPATFWLKSTTSLPNSYSSFTNAPLVTTSPDGSVTISEQCETNVTISGVKFNGYRINSQCFTDQAQYDAAITNFANWFTYYRKRTLAVRGSVGQAFSPIKDARVGEFTINNLPSSASDLTMWDLSQSGDIDGLLTQVYNQGAGGGTPNKSAVNKMGKIYKSRTPTKNASTPPIQYSCQRNFGMLFTDGYSNAETTKFGTVESDSGMGPPFSDSVSGTMADIATKYYQNNLRSDLSGGALLTPSGCNAANPDPRLDCETFPHMQTFAITLPQNGLIYDASSTDPTSCTNDPYQCNNGAGPNWDTLSSDLTKNRNPAAIDDLWHATLDTRGEFLNANTPAQVADSLKKALNTIASENSTAATIATNSTQFTDNTRFYEAEFSSYDWHGDLVSLKLNAAGQTTSVLWDAATELPSSSARNIFTFNDQAGAGGKEFLSADMSTDQSTALTPGSSTSTDSKKLASGNWAEYRLQWLRGDDSAGGSIYRKRQTTALGDIINSDPLYVGNNNFGYAGLEDELGNPLVPGESSYGDYLTSKEAGGGLVVVGANDGMLHAFDASTGREVFAYVPEAVYPNLDLLADPNYVQNHHYYVDGSPTAGDAYVNGSWHTYVVGTLGAGGKGVFGLDVTSLLGSSPSSPTASNIVKWDFSTSAMGNYGSSVDSAPFSFNDLGDTLPKADIALVKCSTCSDAVLGKVWAAIVPNGYDSQSGTAALFILDLNTGKVIREIDTGQSGTNDGLSGAVPVDINGNRTTDYIYAGDLNGNLWKFDLTDPDPRNWTAVDLFTAKDNTINHNPQPITDRPAIGPDGQGGLLIYFGTGRYFRVGDNNVSSSPQTQTFYAVRDANMINQNGNGNGNGHGKSSGLSRSDLLEQDFEVGTSGNGTSSVGNYTVRTSTANTIDFSKKAGWYIDLTGAGTGERVVSSPTLDKGRIIFNTLIPGNSNDPCSYGGDSYLVELNAISGSRLSYAPLDLNGDRLFSQQDYAPENPDAPDGAKVPASAVKWGIGIVRNQAIVGKGNVEYKLAAGTGSTAVKVMYENAGTQSGRLSWRQLR